MKQTGNNNLATCSAGASTKKNRKTISFSMDEAEHAEFKEFARSWGGSPSSFTKKLVESFANKLKQGGAPCWPPRFVLQPPNPQRASARREKKKPRELCTAVFPCRHCCAPDGSHLYGGKCSQQIEYVLTIGGVVLHVSIGPSKALGGNLFNLWSDEDNIATAERFHSAAMSGEPIVSHLLDGSEDTLHAHHVFPIFECDTRKLVAYRSMLAPAFE